MRVVRGVGGHREQWERLYKAYADFYEVAQTPEMRRRVLGWIEDGSLACFLALDAAGRPVGLAHVREFLRPLSATRGGYLDDLYIDPAARGAGVAEAAMAAKAWGKSDPVKLVWRREDDMKAGYYRPAYLHRVKVGLDGDGKILAWRHTIVGQSILSGTPFGAMVKNGVDATSVEGVSDLPYGAPNLHVELHTTKVGVPVLWWRSVGHTHTAYVVEAMIDQIAAETGRDPVEFRLATLKDKPRHLGVLKLAAEKAGWSSAPAEGVFPYALT